MNVVKIQHSQIICVSRANATGLGEDLNYNKGTGDMGDAMSRRHNSVWDDDEEEEW